MYHIHLILPDEYVTSKDKRDWHFMTVRRKPRLNQWVNEDTILFDTELLYMMHQLMDLIKESIRLHIGPIWERRAAAAAAVPQEMPSAVMQHALFPYIYDYQLRK